MKFPKEKFFFSHIQGNLFQINWKAIKSILLAKVKSYYVINVKRMAFLYACKTSFGASC